jgi:5-methyltetrahydrofolate--homocysteine methyltransferase
MHYALVKKIRATLDGECLVDMPDIIENIDIYSAMRGTEEALYDLMDDPELVEARIAQIDDAYFRYYDAFREVIAEPDGTQSYTCFHIRGAGRVAKIQCDFSAMLSPAQFRRFVLPSLEKQTPGWTILSTTWTARTPSATCRLSWIWRSWTRCSGPAAPVSPTAPAPVGRDLRSGDRRRQEPVDPALRRRRRDWIRGAERLMDRYGKQRLYFIFPDMSMRDAETLLNRAEARWK